VSGTAGAIPFNQAYNGPLVMHITNWEDSVTYDWNGGKDINGNPIQVATWYPANIIKMNPALNTQPNESSWGIFQIDQILSGQVTGWNSISTGALTLYDKGSSSTDLVGIFYGGQDVAVKFIDTVTSEAQISAANFKYEIFAQPDTYYKPEDPGATPGLGAGARVDLNEFPHVGYDGTATNTLLPGADRIITGVGQAGMDNFEFFAQFNPASISGSFNTYISTAPLAEAFYSDTTSAGFAGTENVFFDTNIFPCGGFVPVVPGTTADFRLKGGSEPTNWPWLVRSSDPITTAYVPEPVTVLGVFLGLGSLAGYIRRRRAA